MLQTKVSKFAYRRIKAIEQTKGLTSYSLIQMMCDCLIRYMDKQHNLTPMMEKVMSIFEHMVGWADALNLADPSVEMVVGEATYFLYDKSGEKKGARAVHVTAPFFGDWSQDENIQHIIDRTFKLITPERHRRLHELAKELDCSTLLELFDKFIDHFTKEADLAELRRLFEDADRAENNRPIEYGRRTRQKHNRDMENQLRITFQPEDEPEDNSTY